MQEELAVVFLSLVQMGAMADCIRPFRPGSALGSWSELTIEI